MKPTKKIKGFACNQCNQIYEEDFDAEGCCPTEIREAFGWKCDSCDEIHDSKQGGEECCE